ncbi:MAG: type IV secretory system conjugative DNA transfer family protein [Ruminococcus flavefaciens]|nr:type IV secretory system conjugative DNA transfer family protein [Ruminococcus flavefaciens]MCM1059252.1 type IV secretory system conjugative DNA transfer family protein [Eubacterium sp.]
MTEKKKFSFAQEQERAKEDFNPYFNLYIGKEPNLKRVVGSGSGKTRFFIKPNLMPKK